MNKIESGCKRGGGVTGGQANGTQNEIAIISLARLEYSQWSDTASPSLIRMTHGQYLLQCLQWNYYRNFMKLGNNFMWMSASLAILLIIIIVFAKSLSLISILLCVRYWSIEATAATTTKMYFQWATHATRQKWWWNTAILSHSPCVSVLRYCVLCFRI